MTHLTRRQFAALAGASALTPSALFAQSGPGGYPDRPVKLIVPFAPGGVYDSFARPWAEKIKPFLGNTVVVENMGGAGGMIGAATASRAKNDGYTLLLGGGGPHVINPIAARKINYHWKNDFEPIAVATINGLGATVNPSVPVKNLMELIDYLKKNPGQMSYASAGTGSATHLGAELFKRLTGISDLPHVPYKGGGASLVDLVSGQVKLSFVNITGQILELHKQGKLRILAMTTPQRMKGAPDIPTCEEAGLKDMIALNFTALFAPAGTPRPIIDHVANATRKLLAEPEFQKYLVSSGAESSPDDTPEKTAAFLESEHKRWGPVIKDIGLKIG